MDLEGLYSNVVARDILGRFFPGFLAYIALGLGFLGLGFDIKALVEAMGSTLPYGPPEEFERVVLVLIISYLLGLLIETISDLIDQELRRAPNWKAEVLDFFPQKNEEVSVFDKQLRASIPEFVFGVPLRDLKEREQDMNHAVTAIAKYMQGKDESAYRNFVAVRHIMSRALRALRISVAILALGLVAYLKPVWYVGVSMGAVAYLVIWVLYKAAAREYQWAYRHMFEWFLIDQRDSLGGIAQVEEEPKGN